MIENVMNELKNEFKKKDALNAFNLLKKNHFFQNLGTV